MDRNRDGAHGATLLRVSLSARRAWIEMLQDQTEQESTTVALRKESVDRNRGWTLNINGPMTVALRKESVDRN